MIINTQNSYNRLFCGIRDHDIILAKQTNKKTKRCNLHWTCKNPVRCLEHISVYNALSITPLYKILTLKECKWGFCLEYAAHRFCEIIFRVFKIRARDSKIITEKNSTQHISFRKIDQGNNSSVLKTMWFCNLCQWHSFDLLKWTIQISGGSILESFPRGYLVIERFVCYNVTNLKWLAQPALFLSWFCSHINENSICNNRTAQVTLFTLASYLHD